MCARGVREVFARCARGVCQVCVRGAQSVEVTYLKCLEVRNVGILDEGDLGTTGYNEAIQS